MTKRPGAAAKPRAHIIRVTTTAGPFPGASPPTLKRRAAKMLAALELGPTELSVALVDDATIQGLNKDYRRKNKPTDVLSFAMREENPQAREPKARGGRGGEPELLGDVILSVDTARRQAATAGRTLLAELTMLLAHGLLHLLGYDHRTKAEERDMVARTRALELAASARAPAKATRRLARD